MNSLYLVILRFLLMKKLHSGFNTFMAFVVISLIIVGCEHTNSVIVNSVLNKNAMSFSKFPKEEIVVFKNIYEYKEGIAGMLKLVDSTLIIFNVLPRASNLLNNYSLDSGILSTGYFGKGRGPGEAMGPRAIGVNVNSLWLQDITLKKVFTINKRKVLNTTKSFSFNEYNIENQYYMIDLKDSLHFFGVGYINSAYKIQEIDLISGKVTNEYGKIEKTPGNMPLQLFKSVYQSLIFSIRPTNPS